MNAFLRANSSRERQSMAFCGTACALSLSLRGTQLAATLSFFKTTGIQSVQTEMCDHALCDRIYLLEFHTNIFKIFFTPVRFK